MKRVCKNNARGFTVVELMVTILIVTVLSVTLGVFFVKLLTLQEREREDAYVREKLADICAEYAEMLSVGSSFTTNSDGMIVAMYPLEAGGVSLETGGNYETGVVVRVSVLTSMVQRVTAAVDRTNADPMTTLDLYVCSMNSNGRFFGKRLLSLNGDSELLPVKNCIIQDCRLTYLWTNALDGASAAECFSMGLLEVTASYEYKDKDRNRKRNVATARRVVRLWNGK